MSSPHPSPLISIPPKTTEDVDFSTSIRQIIGHTYGERPDGYAEEIATLGRCRSDAVKGAGSDVTARDLLYKYFGQLELLELRFADMKVSFHWRDAFTSKVTSQTSLAFEKASIIFLLSSVLSSIAASSPRTSPEGVKRAYNSARSAAGMLTFINENFLHAPSTDLSREVVKLLSGLMITQAGEMLVEKVISENKPHGMIAKMAQGVATGYSGLVDEVKDFQGKGIIDRAWLGILSIKAKMFASLAQYHRARHDDDKGDHGAAMVRFGIAHAAAQEASRLAKEFTYTFIPPFGTTAGTLPTDAPNALVEITKSQLAVCAEAKDQSQKDNDLVYHSIPPSESSLPAIEVLSTTTPIPIQEIYANPEVSNLIGPDIFRRLVPMEVHTSASVYSEEKAKLGRGESERCALSEGEVRAALEDMGMPGKIRRYREVLEGGGDVGSGPSSEVLRWAEEVSRKEGRRGGTVDDLMRRLEEVKAGCRNQLDTLNQEMEDESRECEKMRVKYTHLWTQPPSGSYTRGFRDDLKSHRTSLDAAESSDRSIIALWEGARADIDLLRGGPSRIEAVYAAAASGKPMGQPSLLDLDAGQEEMDDRERAEISTAVDELEEKMERLTSIRRERDEVLKDLKEKIQADDVSHLLLLNRRTQDVEPTLFATELEKFRPYQTRVSAAIASQSSTLQDISATMKRIDSGKTMRDIQRKWSAGAKSGADLERRLRSAWEAYEEVRTGLEKGLHFYESMQTLIDTLKRDVRHFITSRTNERNRLASDADARSRLSSSPPPASPPAVSSPMRGLEQQLKGMSLGGAASSSWSSSPATQARPPASTSPYPPPPPPQARQPSTSAYDFDSLGSLPSAFSTAPKAPSATPSYGQPSSLPPPPPKPTYGQPPPPSAASPYAGGPSYAPPSTYGSPSQSYSPYPPPPTQQDYRSASAYPSPPPPSNPYSSYQPPQPPQPPRQSSSTYPTSPPPSQSPYSYPSQTTHQTHQPSYASPPPPGQWPPAAPPAPPQIGNYPGQAPYFPTPPQHDPYRYQQR